MTGGAGTLRPRVSGVPSLRIFLQRFIVAFVVAAVISGAVMAGANVIENQKLSGINRIKLPNNLLAPSTSSTPSRSRRASR